VYFKKKDHQAVVLNINQTITYYLNRLLISFFSSLIALFHNV
jgi:hypothetical protein